MIEKIMKWNNIITLKDYILFRDGLINISKIIFPFGYGLSYSSFNYSYLKLSMNKEGLIFKFNAKNTNPNLGQADLMKFLTFLDIIENIFKGFDKVDLKPVVTNKITIFEDNHVLSYFNVSKNNYIRFMKV